MAKSKTLHLKFKPGFGMPSEFLDRTGFMWLNDHERDVDEEYANFLLNKFPRNFTLIEPPKAKPVVKEEIVQDMPAVEKSEIKPVQGRKTKTK